MSQSLDDTFELYWQSIQIPPDDKTNWKNKDNEGFEELLQTSNDFLMAMKPTIKRAFMAGYDVRS